MLETLTDVFAGPAAERLAVVAGRPPDPRVDEWLVRVFEVLPYRATSTKVFWKPAFAPESPSRPPMWTIRPPA